MELTVTKRIPGKKAETKKIRREGDIPAVVYSQGNKGEEIVVSGNAFKKILNQVQQGTLSTKVFTLLHGGKKTRAVLKDIQYNVVTYDVIHLDFEELHKDALVTVNVPILCTGTVDCAGVKLGGALRQVIRHVKVRCLPEHIPSHFEIDVREMGVEESRRLSDIEVPHEVRPLIDLKEIVVTISKR